MTKQNFDKNILNSYRFIVSSGCSYGRIAEYTFKAFRGSMKSDFLYDQYGKKNWLDLDEKVIVLSPSLGSQGSDWQADSTIHMCNRLLEMGVESQNIYVIVEWSQWHRFSVHPFNYINLDLSKLEFNSDTDFYYDIINKENQNSDNFEKVFLNELWQSLKICRSKFLSIPKINDRIYMTPNHMPTDFFESLGSDYSHFIEQAKKIDSEMPLENKLKTYLNNLLRTQFFLEGKGLKYNFFFMQSTLSEWYKDDNGMLKDGFMKGLKSISSNYNPINDKNTDLELVAPELSNEVNLLNFNNIWFYENERYRRGGIDEWTLDTFKECGFIRLNSNSENSLRKNDVTPDYGGHPNSVAYTLLWNKVAKNCDFAKLKPDFEDFIYNKFMEDYNSNEFSKNGLTISKHKWDEITGNRK